MLPILNSIHRYAFAMILSQSAVYMNRVFFEIEYLNLNKINSDCRFLFAIPNLNPI